MQAGNKLSHKSLTGDDRYNSRCDIIRGLAIHIVDIAGNVIVVATPICDENRHGHGVYGLDLRGEEGVEIVGRGAVLDLAHRRVLRRPDAGKKE